MIIKENETYDNCVHQNDQYNQSVNRKAYLTEYIHHCRTAIQCDDHSAFYVVLDRHKVVM